MHAQSLHSVGLNSFELVKIAVWEIVFTEVIDQRSMVKMIHQGPTVYMYI